MASRASASWSKGLAEAAMEMVMRFLRWGWPWYSARCRVRSDGGSEGGL